MSVVWLTSDSDGLILNCNFAYRNTWASLETNAYSCLAEVLFLSDPRNVTEVSFNHLAGRNNSDVKLLIIQNQLLLTVFPRNIYQFFPNLEGLQVGSSSIAEFNREDLRGLDKLKGIHVYSGKITEIESETFENQPQLERLAIESMQIQHFGRRVFDYLPMLNRLHVQQNPCINTYVTNRAAVVNLIAQIFRSCPPSFEMTLTEILESPKFLGIVEQEVAYQVNPHRVKLLETERRVERLEERVRVLEEKQ